MCEALLEMAGRHHRELDRFADGGGGGGFIGGGAASTSAAAAGGRRSSSRSIPHSESFSTTGKKMRIRSSRGERMTFSFIIRLLDDDCTSKNAKWLMIHVRVHLQCM